MNTDAKNQEEQLTVRIPRSRIRFSDPCEQIKFDGFSPQQAQEAMDETLLPILENCVFTFTF